VERRGGPYEVLAEIGDGLKAIGAGLEQLEGIKDALKELKISGGTRERSEELRVGINDREGLDDDELVTSIPF